MNQVDDGDAESSSPPPEHDFYDDYFDFNEEDSDDDEDYCDDHRGGYEGNNHAQSPAPSHEPRLDSFDSYIVVSVLTATASFAALLDDNSGSSGDCGGGGKSLSRMPGAHNAAIVICAICSLSGIYSTVVFSFSSIYGRTAVGAGKMEAYEQFLQATASLRKKAFRAYVTSLVLFIVLLVIAATDKIDSELEILFLGFLTVLSVLMYRDWTQIIVAAGPIFAGGAKKEDEKDEATISNTADTETVNGEESCIRRSHGMRLRSSSNKFKQS